MQGQVDAAGAHRQRGDPHPGRVVRRPGDAGCRPELGDRVDVHGHLQRSMIMRVPDHVAPAITALALAAAPASAAESAVRSSPDVTTGWPPTNRCSSAGAPNTSVVT